MSSNIKPPDFDDMMAKAEWIGVLTREVNLLDVELKSREGEFIRNTIAGAEGKPPSMEYLKMVVKEMFMPARERLATADAELEQAKLVFQVMRDMVSVYITESAAQRASVL